MSEVLVEAKGIGKRYRRGMLGGIRLPRLFGRHSGDGVSDEFWALKDIDLELREGDSLGIIGPNGAGKSTLLKILSRVTAPTEGVLKVRGRVGALIEVGAGFHQELSGRDNIFINGAILGMSRKEIQRRFDEIVAFAELEDFIDTPVKKYSSGMYVRLGFAVAAHMDPDILLIDEVLAVGDGRFQKKCFEAMTRFRQAGIPVVLVSHSMYNIQRNCRTGILLHQGQVASVGPITDVINYYQESIRGQATEGALVIDDVSDRCSYDMVITDVELLDEQGQPARQIDTGSALRVRISYEVRTPQERFAVRIAFVDDTSEILAVNDSALEGFSLMAAPQGGSVECCFPRIPFTHGDYMINVNLLDASSTVHYDRWRGMVRPNLRFSVRPDAKSANFEQWRGLVNIDCSWLSAAVLDQTSSD